MKPGYYASVEDVLKAMQLDKNLVNFLYSKLTQRVTVKWRGEDREHRFLVSFSPHLSAKLGFGYNRSSWRRLGGGNAKVTAPNAVTMDFLDLLYVNCDLAADAHVVGDRMVPLLKCVSVTGEHGEPSYHEPRILDWLPLRRNRFDTIRVLITDGTGKIVPFERGHSMVKVHVRERRPF